MNSDWKEEIESGTRFRFGNNWNSFLSTLNTERIQIARESLCTMLKVENLNGLKFLDVGCGSGLFSLCAYQLGAEVVSFDFDPESIACAKFLRKHFANDDELRWQIMEGSVLDRNFIASLGQFDIVYSWGVLHHTGSMWQALDNVDIPVKHGGKLFISIYNDQGRTSRRWLNVKRFYNKSPWIVKQILLAIFIVRFTAIGTIKEIILLRPFKEWRDYKKSRGMSRIQNIRDWIGGLPFEVAKPEQIIFFFKDKKYSLENLITCGGGIGCNEYVFSRK